MRRIFRYVRAAAVGAVTLVTALLLFPVAAGANYNQKILGDFYLFPKSPTTSIQVVGVSNVHHGLGGRYDPEGRFELTSHCAKFHSEPVQVLQKGNPKKGVGGADFYGPVALGMLEVENNSAGCFLTKSREIALVKAEPSGQVLAYLDIEQAGGFREFRVHCGNAAIKCSGPGGDSFGHSSAATEADWLYTFSKD